MHTGSQNVTEEVRTLQEAVWQLANAVTPQTAARWCCDSVLTYSFCGKWQSEPKFTSPGSRCRPRGSPQRPGDLIRRDAQSSAGLEGTEGADLFPVAFATEPSSRHNREVNPSPATQPPSHEPPHPHPYDKFR